MTRAESVCRWEIVLAHWEWQIVTNHAIQGMAWYARALGLDPTVVIDDETQPGPQP